MDHTKAISTSFNYQQLATMLDSYKNTFDMPEKNVNDVDRVIKDLQKYPCDNVDIAVNPDKYVFEHKGLRCKLYRPQALGVWCGYVYYSGNYNASTIVVHGGISFRDHEMVGFDCGYLTDITLMELARNVASNRPIKGKYRDYEYARSQLILLADQLSEL